MYAGKVFPLLRGNRIDLSAAAVDKSKCSRFLAPGQVIPYTEVDGGSSDDGAGIDAWYVETNRFGHYVVFDAGEDVAEALAGRLDDAGLDVIRWDESFRPADDGVQYDWFIRLGFNGERSEVIRLVEAQVRAMGSRHVAPKHQADESQLDKMRRSLLEVAQKLVAAQGAEARATKSKADLERQVRTITAQARATETESEELRKELASSNRTRSRLRTEVKNLRKQVADLPAPSTKDEDAADIPSEAAQWYEAFAEADEELAVRRMDSIALKQAAAKREARLDELRRS